MGIRRWRRGDQGASALEFALVLPVLLMLVFGCIQFGMVMAQKASLANGAREGARVASVNIVTPPTCDVIMNTVKAAANTIGIQTSQVQVSIERIDVPPNAANPGSEVGTPVCVNSSDPAPCVGGNDTSRLRVVATLTNRTIVIPPFINFGPFDLKSQGTYRCEYS